MEFIYEHVWGIVATVTTTAFALLAAKYSDKYEAVKEFLSTFLAALEDGSLTPEEIQALVRVGKKIIGKGE